MNPSIFKLKHIGTGQLYIMPCPRPQVLAEDMAYYMNLGIDTIVCLLEKPEMIVRGLALEEHLCQEFDLDFEHFSIPDQAVPRNLTAFRGLVNNLETELRQGRNLAIHCYAGIGRTGVLAGSLLIRDGMTPQAAMNLMSDRRGCPMPQTQIQYEFLMAQRAPTTRIAPDNSNLPLSRSWWQRLIA